MIEPLDKNNNPSVPFGLISIPASIQIGENRYRGDIVNITSTSAGLILIEPLNFLQALPSPRLTLHIVNFGDFEVKITHIDNHRILLEFCENHKAMMGLIRSCYNS